LRSRVVLDLLTATLLESCVVVVSRESPARQADVRVSGLQVSWVTTGSLEGG
jgi:hypothetical protein